jgi:hypothetical protein
MGALQDRLGRSHVMPKELTVILVDRPGTLADAGEALGRAGINVDGVCGFPAGGEGILHVLVEDAATAREALSAAGLEVRDERDVAVTAVEDQPGAGGRLLRGIADAGVNINLIYLTTDGRLVLGGEDVAAIERALG